MTGGHKYIILLSVALDISHNYPRPFMPQKCKISGSLFPLGSERGSDFFLNLFYKLICGHKRFPIENRFPVYNVLILCSMLILCNFCLPSSCYELG